MREIRCKYCGKLLAKANVADIEIVCPKCKAKNRYKVNKDQDDGINDSYVYGPTYSSL